MPPSLGRKLRKVETVAHLGPEDPEDLLGADALAYPRTHSRVSLFGGLVGLEPVLATETVQNGLRPLPARRKNGNGEQHNLVQNHQAHLRADPLEFSKQLSLWATGTGWRAYNDYIGGRVFYEGYSDSCVRAIMTSPQVLAQQHQVTEQRLALLHLPNGPEKLAKRARIEKLVREETSKIANGLVARMDSVRFLRFFGALVNNLLVRLYHQGIEISIPEYARFKEIAVLAAKKKQSLLIVPCHKSHIDYLTISWLFFRLGLSLPHIVAGENLNMPIVGPTLAKCGAFFIRRTFGPDPLYNVVVKDYIEQLLANGKNSSRSRTGKLLPPKLGILKYVCDAVENGITDDVWLCPISLQYDRVIETESYINELLGNPKEKESLSGLLLNTRVIQFELGRIDKPFSLRAWLDEQKKHRSEVGPSGKRPKSDQATLLKALGYEVLSGINDCAIIMPAGLVGTTLLTMRGRGVGKTELIKRILWLKGAIETRGGRVADFGDMPVEEVVERTLLVLKDLIGEKRDLIEPTYHPLDRFQLSFYRNQNEFVYQGDGLEANAERTIASLKDDQVILVEGELIGLSPEERAAGRNNFDWLAAASLFALTPTSSPPSAEQPVAWFAEKAFQASAQLLAKTLFAQGDVSYWEAVNQGPLCNVPNTTPLDLTDSWWRTATLSNAFQRMVDLGVILTRRSTTGNKPVALMALHPDWVPLRLEDGEIAPEGKLWSFVDRLSRFRREGKNRRDNRTVSARVFMHCSAISPEVVEYSAFTYDKPASDFWAEKRTANL
ncbi:SPOSA6832_03065, partial [Sporobolomyces salmonicolor]